MIYTILGRRVCQLNIKKIVILLIFVRVCTFLNRNELLYRLLYRLLYSCYIGCYIGPDSIRTPTTRGNRFVARKLRNGILLLKAQYKNIHFRSHALQWSWPPLPRIPMGRGHRWPANKLRHRILPLQYYYESKHLRPHALWRSWPFPPRIIKVRGKRLRATMLGNAPLL